MRCAIEELCPKALNLVRQACVKQKGVEAKVDSTV